MSSVGRSSITFKHLRSIGNLFKMYFVLHKLEQTWYFKTKIISDPLSCPILFPSQMAFMFRCFHWFVNICALLDFFPIIKQFLGLITIKSSRHFHKIVMLTFLFSFDLVYILSHSFEFCFLDFNWFMMMGCIITLARPLSRLLWKSFFMLSLGQHFSDGLMDFYLWLCFEWRSLKSGSFSSKQMHILLVTFFLLVTYFSMVLFVGWTGHRVLLLIGPQLQSCHPIHFLLFLLVKQNSHHISQFLNWGAIHIIRDFTRHFFGR